MTFAEFELLGQKGLLSVSEKRINAVSLLLNQGGVNFEADPSQRIIHIVTKNSVVFSFWDTTRPIHGCWINLYSLHLMGK